MSVITYAQFKNSFDFVEFLGKGNCAEVRKIRQVSTSQVFALKICQSQNFAEMSQVTGEIEIMSSLNDDAVPKIYHYYFREDAPFKKPCLYEIGIVMELCDRTLEREIEDINNGKIQSYNQSRMWDFMAKMIRFFAKMQKLGFNHRDIKPGNIMIKREGYQNKYKVIDFGYSLKYTPFSSQNITGTIEYASPKVKRKFMDHSIVIPGGLNVKDDVYSFGKTILELLRGKQTKNEKLVPSFFQGKIRSYDSNLAFLLSKMLEREEPDRWDFIQVEKEIIKIQNLKASNNIIIDADDSIPANFQSGYFDQGSSQSISLYPQAFSSPFKKIKDSRTIESQTISLQINPAVSNFANKFLNIDRHSAQTKYLENRPEQANSVHSKMYLSRCSFETEVFSMKAFDGFLLLGMRNRLGVVPLKQKNDAIYTFRVKSTHGTAGKTTFNQIMVFGAQLVLFGDSNHYFYCNLQDFINRMNSLFENHESQEKGKEIRQVLRKSFGKDTEYREPRLYEGKLDFFDSGMSDSKISCLNVCTQPFLGSNNAPIFGHLNGSITFPNLQSEIHKEDDKIVDIVGFGGKNLLFATGEGWIKMLIFPSEVYQQSAKPEIYKYETGTKVLRINLLNPVANRPEYCSRLKDSALAEAYLSNGQKILLDHELNILASITIKSKAHFSNLTQSPWRLSIQNQGQNNLSQMVCERKSSMFSQKSQLETYVVTNEGQIYSSKTRQLLADFHMNNAVAGEVSKDVLAAVDFEGKLQLLYPEEVFDNVQMPRRRISEQQKEVSRQAQKISEHFMNLKLQAKKLNKSEAQEAIQSLQKVEPKTYAQFMASIGKKLDFGVGRRCMSKKVQQLIGK